MLSFSILIVAVAVSTLFTGWAIAAAARALGSTRGRFSVGLRVVLFLGFMGIAFLLAIFFLPFQDPWRLLGASLALQLAQIFVIFLVLRRAFAPPTGRTWGLFGIWIGVNLLQAGLAFALLRPFVLQAFVFPSKSMSPTIAPGDRFIVNKLLTPRRWDLVVYRTRGVDSIPMCKRLVGLPGEKLQFGGGGVFINDQAVIAPPVLVGRCCAAQGAVPAASSRYRDRQPIILGPNEFFFVGDNVDLSMDSRITGPSDRASIVGVVDLMYWPPAKAVVRLGSSKE